MQGFFAVLRDYLTAVLPKPSTPSAVCMLQACGSKGTPAGAGLSVRLRRVGTEVRKVVQGVERSLT